MEKKLQFKIVTPERVVFEDMVLQVSLPTEMGEITIMKNHEPLVSLLRAGEMRIVTEEKEDILAVAGGMVYVADNSLVVLADSATHATEIDIEVAEEARAKAEKIMSDRTLDSEEHAEAAAVFAREITKLRIAKKYKRSKIK